jgi:hypothetical protein
MPLSTGFDALYTAVSDSTPLAVSTFSFGVPSETFCSSQPVPVTAVTVQEQQGDTTR